MLFGPNGRDLYSFLFVNLCFITLITSNGTSERNRVTKSQTPEDRQRDRGVGEGEERERGCWKRQSFPTIVYYPSFIRSGIDSERG